MPDKTGTPSTQHAAEPAEQKARKITAAPHLFPGLRASTLFARKRMSVKKPCANRVINTD